MTTLLKKAMHRLAEETIALPEEGQDHIAKLILTALDDLHWDRQFSESKDILELLYDETVDDFANGRTIKLGG